jgi:peptidoglycan/LPS O-acetylase OafA/YrhL
VGEFSFQGVFSGTLSVDSFFMLSGLLTSYVFLREIKRVKTARKINWVLFYFHRVWRLSPPYFFFLFIYSTTYRYIWDGPAFPQKNGLEGFCPDNWWTNLLYVNNIVKRDQACMGWSWYLANDMQFYIISPIFLLSLHYFPILGVILTSLACLASIIATGLISAYYDLQIGTFGMTGNGFTNLYVVPWCRISPYLLGLLAGFILVKTRCQLRLHWAYQLALWAAAIGICLSVVYGPYGVNKGTVTLSTEISALYNATFRFAWTLGISWMIIACCCGMGGWINNLLSWKLLIPLSRLSYCAYLVHPVIIYFLYQTQFTAMKSTHASMAINYCAALCLSYAGAYVLSMMAEAPFLGLEKIFIRKH